MRRFYLTTPCSDPNDTLGVPIRMVNGCMWDDGQIWIHWTAGLGGGFGFFRSLHELETTHVITSLTQNRIDWIDERTEGLSF